MPTANLTRDIGYLDLVSELRADPEGMGQYARELVEATGAGTILDADRALTVLTHRDPDGFAWDRPLTRKDREDRVKAYAEHIASLQGRLKQGIWGSTPERTWRNFMGCFWGVVGLLVLLMPVEMWFAEHGSSWAEKYGVAITILLPGVLISLAGPVAADPWLKEWVVGIDQKRFPEIQVQLKAAQLLLEEESLASVSDREAERWLAFPEVARQARRWIRSSPGLMKRDVELLDARLAELHAAEEAHRKSSLLRRLVGWT